jgi:hypothetical protein
MLTPKEILLLERMKSQPNLLELFTRLELEPVVSDAYRLSLKVSARVQQIMDDLRSKPVVERLTFQEGSASSLGQIFCPESVIQAYIRTLYPNPCYPLSSAPF